MDRHSSPKRLARTIAGQVGETDERHRFRAPAAMGISRTRTEEYRKQRRCKGLQHILTSLRASRAAIDRIIKRDCCNTSSLTEPNTASPRSFILAAVKKYTTPALSYLSWAIASFWLVWVSSPANSAPQIGATAPELVVTELDGQIFDLAKLKGKVVLVNYWATWCAPCKKDMPRLDAFYRRHHGQNLEMIGISVDRPNDLPKVLKITASLAYPVAVLKDITVDGFGEPEGVPITWIIDADGKVRDRMIDVRDELLGTLVVPLLLH
jgi:cytochrome c biogenesis protein CcmG, thiol:disulfide interchange protein DsbE